MIGAAIGGAMKIGGAIFGGVSASKAMKQVKKNLEQQRRDNQDWYDRRYNEDATQRADAQRILTITNENIRQRNKQSAGVAAVMGGTEESVAATKAANNQAMAEAASQIAVAGDRRKDSIESQYRATDHNLQSQLNNMEMQRANMIKQAVGGISSAAGNMANDIEDYLDYRAELKESAGKS